jgi:hypothetical protein
MLFILATKTLQGMIAASQQDLFQIPGAPTELLQFADDTIIFTPAHPQKLTHHHEYLTPICGSL